MTSHVIIDSPSALTLRAASDVQQLVADGQKLGVMTGGAKALIQRPGSRPSPARAHDADLVDAARVFTVALLNELSEHERVLIAWTIERGFARPWVSCRAGETALLLEWRAGELQLIGRRGRVLH